MLVKSCHLHHERVVGGRARHRTIGTHHHGRAKRPTIGAAGRAELCLQVAHPPLQLSHLNTLSVIVCVSTNLSNELNHDPPFVGVLELEAAARGRVNAGPGLASPS